MLLFLRLEGSMSYHENFLVFLGKEIVSLYLNFVYVPYSCCSKVAHRELILKRELKIMV